MPLQSSQQLDRTALAVGLIDGLEEGNDAAAVLSGDERRPIFDDRSEEVMDLQGVVVVGRIDCLESGTVFGLEAVGVAVPRREWSTCH